MSINKSHAKNKDKFLAKGTPDEVSAADIKNNIDNIIPNKLDGVESSPVLVMHFEGDDGDTFTTDATGRHTPSTLSAGAEIDTAFKKYGNSSLSVPDINGTPLTIPASTDFTDLFNALDSDSTISLFYRMNGASHDLYFINVGSGSNSFAFQQTTTPGFGLMFELKNSGSPRVRLYSGVLPTDNNWHHAAVVKKGQDSGLYLDGVQVAHWFQTVVGDVSGDWKIGHISTGQKLDGNMDELVVAHHNMFNGNPDAGLSDTIVVPTGPQVDAGDIIKVSANGGDASRTSLTEDQIRKAVTLPQGIDQVSAGALAGELWVDTANGYIVKMGI
jgi:hypothetical protein